MQGTASSRARAEKESAAVTPAKTTKRPLSSTSPNTRLDKGAGTANVHGKAVGSLSGLSAGARLGLAGAGIGQGGKVGKELNEEKNAQPRAESNHRKSASTPADGQGVSTFPSLSMALMLILCNE